MSTDLLRAAKNAAAVIGAVYEWLERVEKAGGATSKAAPVRIAESPREYKDTRTKFLPNLASSSTLIFGNSTFNKVETGPSKLRAKLTKAKASLKNVTSVELT